MDSSSPAASPLQLAMAAIAGASLMAISAFYIHRRSVDQLLDRILLRWPAAAFPRTRSAEPSGTEEEDEKEESEEETEGKRSWRWDAPESRAEDRRPLSCGLSTSLPNVVSATGHWMAEEDDLHGPVQNARQSSFGGLSSIPPGLPSLHTPPNDEIHENSTSRLNPTSAWSSSTPKLSVGTAFTGMEASDERDAENEDHTHSYYNEDGSFASTNFMHKHDAEENVQDSLPAAFEVTNGNTFQDKDNGLVISGSHSTKIRQCAQPKGRKAVEVLQKDHDVMPLNTTLHEVKKQEEEEVCAMLQDSLSLRDRYVYRETAAPWLKETIAESAMTKLTQDPFHFVPAEPSSHFFQMVDGVVLVYENERATEVLYPVSSSTMFFTDMHHILKMVSLGNARSLCHSRLRLLEEKFHLHLLINADREFLSQKGAPHRDFYNVRKVDTHIHHSACMNQKHLLRFIKSKLRKEPDEVVIFRDGKYLTLDEVFKSLDLTGYDLNVDLLDVHTVKNSFRQIDKFDLKYNPCGQSRLREIFLQQENLIQGRFMGELTKQVLSDLEANKCQMAEYRVSIYGRKHCEWDQLASWFINNKIHSENAVWLIQLPRLYNVYKRMGLVTSFQSILDNVFTPLFEVTINPCSHPELHVFLKQVVGFDIVDDESKSERRPTKHMPKPAEWINEFNPAYSYYAYYCYANLYSLNKLRESKGMATIKFRPHCGEAGDIDHLVAAFLLSHNIAHGINLRKSPVLQYLYYLSQIGLSMSPLSNNSLFLDYHRNPFPMFFKRGLNVSLSTNDPLHVHLTKEPLVEEYSVAAKVWKLTSCDLCETARNSVYQSGFSHAEKSRWLGSKYFRRGPEGNDVHKTNVPHMRIAFRYEVWKQEMQYVYSGKARLPEEIDP